MYLEDNLDKHISALLQQVQKRILTETTYCGVKALTNPMDFWVYQEIIFRSKPDIIIEIGTNWGGTALALAHQLDLIGKGRFIGVDIDLSKVPNQVREHPRITLLESDAVQAYQTVREIVSDVDKVLIIEDSSHTFENTLNVLRAYCDFVSVGGYFIVEDSICHHGLDVGPEPGPYEAIEAFIKGNDKFIIDRSMESFVLTWNPKGFLKRIR